MDSMFTFDKKVGDCILINIYWHELIDILKLNVIFDFHLGEMIQFDFGTQVIFVQVDPTWI